MKKMTIAALLAAQIVSAAQPAFAADLGPAAQEQRAGAFGGLRVRVPLDGAPRQRQVRAGLAFAPTLQRHVADGAVRTQIGEGFEFGYRSGRPLAFSVAGRDLVRSRLGAAQDRERRGLSTGQILLIAGGVIVVTLGVLTLVAVDEINDNSD